MPARIVRIPVLVSLLTGALAAPAPAQSPQAADQTLGMAILSATVRNDGVLVRVAGAASVVRPATGIYDVTFQRDVANCSCVASAGEFAVGLSDLGVIATANCPHAANVVRVRTTDHAGTSSNRNFHLIVFCPK
jgi:hypothetical protein